MLNEFDVFLKDGDKANLTAAIASENNTYAHETNDWPQTVYYAWVLYGAVSFQVGLYWMQRYYFDKLGVEHSRWLPLAGDLLCGFSADTSCRDLARFGLLWANAVVSSKQRRGHPESGVTVIPPVA